jgi:hypothetical protein
MLAPREKTAGQVNDGLSLIVEVKLAAFRFGGDFWYRFVGP